MSKAVSVYVSGARGTSEQRRRPLAGLLALLFAFFALASGLNLLPETTKHDASTASAAVVTFCSAKDSLGPGFDQRDWATYAANYALPDSRNRTWTLQEAFGGNTRFPTYEGEGSPKAGWFAGTEPVGADRVKSYSQLTKRMSQLESYRNANNCIWGRFTNSVADTGTGAATLFVSITQYIAVKAFDPSFICSKASDTNCMNIVKIVGGDSSGGGIISALRNSIYMPLLVIVVFLAACWIGWTGMKLHKTREALWGVVWVCLSVIFGLMFLLKPMMLAQAPMTVSNAISSCIIGSFNGDNCMSNSNSGESALSTTGSTSTDICKSSVSSGSASQDMTMAVNGLSCSIWKAFVLEPWSTATYRKSFEELDTLDTKNTEVRTAIQTAGAKPQDFCVFLSTTGSVNAYTNKPLTLDGTNHKICNLGAYQLFLMTRATSPDTGSKLTSATKEGDQNASQNSEAPQALWYKYMNVLAADDGLWNAWAPTAGNSSFHAQVSTVAWITALAGSVILALTAIMALVYYIIMAISMSLASLFFLAMVHPTRGKKLFYGWLEIVASNLFKYIASAIFLILAIAFYAAVLGSVTNIWTTAVIVAIISVALWVYRREVINLLGRANMGGEKLSNGMEQFMKKHTSQASRVSKAALGASIGTVAANGGFSTGLGAGMRGMKESWAKTSGNNTLSRLGQAAITGAKDSTLDVADNFNPKHIGEAVHGAKDGAKSQLKRGNGITANVLRERARIEQDAKSDLASQVRSAEGAESKATANFNGLRTAAVELENNAADADKELVGATRVYEEAEGQEKSFQDVRVRLLMELGGNNEALASILALQAQAENLTNQATIANSLGTDAGRAQAVEFGHRAKIARNTALNMRSNYVAQINEAGGDGDRQFASEVDAFAKDLQAALPAAERDYSSAKYVGASVAMNEAGIALNEAVERRDANKQELEEANMELAVATQRQVSLRKAHERLRPGDHISPQRVKELSEGAERITIDTVDSKYKEELPQLQSTVTAAPVQQALTVDQDLSGLIQDVRRMSNPDATDLRIGFGDQGSPLPGAASFSPAMEVQPPRTQQLPNSDDSDRPPEPLGGHNSGDDSPPLPLPSSDGDGGPNLPPIDDSNSNSNSRPPLPTGGNTESNRRPSANNGPNPLPGGSRDTATPPSGGSSGGPRPSTTNSGPSLPPNSGPSLPPEGRPESPTPPLGDSANGNPRPGNTNGNGTQPPRGSGGGSSSGEVSTPSPGGGTDPRPRGANSSPRPAEPVVTDQPRLAPNFSPSSSGFPQTTASRQGPEAPNLIDPSRQPIASPEDGNSGDFPE